MHEWHAFTPDEWAAASRAGTDRDEQKRGYQSSRYWHPDSHFLGLLGEIIYGRVSGRPVNLELDPAGDGGTDFGDVDVKASTYWDDPILKHPVAAIHWAPFFALVALNLDRREGFYAGWATRDELRLGEIRTFTPKAGPQRTLRRHHLHFGLP